MGEDIVSMPNFQIAIEKPDEIIPSLGKKEHWKKGRSAYELSSSWIQAKGFPPSVRAVLDQADEWRDADLLEGFFERETELPGRGRPSQTDLLALVRLKQGNAILGIEGKVDEPFGELVEDWLKGKPDEKAGEPPEATAARQRSTRNRRERFNALCGILEINPADSDGFYYQLFHRTCASIYEAKRFECKRAIVLVHSFAAIPEAPLKPACFEDFSAFTTKIGMTVIRPGAISTSKTFAGIELRLGWVSDNSSS
ncbi:DUF6946 family protein [Reyranella sp.]|uniref:DUF6946 family protein n=1 Tax=Reyranella sp. TaxID=1929291 RepID=UPI003C7A0AFA